jgi:hypothetical protein
VLMVNGVPHAEQDDVTNLELHEGDRVLFLLLVGGG